MVADFNKNMAILPCFSRQNYLDFVWKFRPILCSTFNMGNGEFIEADAMQKLEVIFAFAIVT